MKNYIISGIVSVIAVVIGFWVYSNAQPPLGAQSVNVTEGNCYSFQGVLVCPSRIGMKTATTTVCAIKSPAATSTLIRASAQFTYSSTTASIVTLAKAATAYATTTTLGDFAIAAGKSATAVASTTTTGSSQVDGVTTFAPNNWLVVSMASSVSASAGTFSPTGFCQATFEVN